MDDDAAQGSGDALEQALLGLMMGRRDAVWETLRQLHPTDFASPRHETIARCIVRLAQSGKPSDVLAVGDALEQDGQLVQAGGLAYLHQLDGATGDPAFLAGRIHTRAVRRRFRQFGQAILDADPNRDPRDLLAAAQVQLRRLEASAAAQPIPVRDRSGDALDEVGATGPVAMPTPWAGLNQLIGGIVPGRLYVVGARPAEGKSMLALNLAAHLARGGAGVTFTSMEMAAGEVMRRLVAAESEVPLSKLEYGGLRQDDWQAVAEARKRIDAMPLFIDDRVDVDVLDVKLYALAAAHQAKIRVVVVDYLSLLRTPDDRRSRWEHVGQITREFKQLARDLDVAVVLLAQLSRGYEEARGKKPRPPALHDLRESGNIEQDADVVMLLQRGHRDDGVESHILNVHVAKHRQGRRGLASLLWRAHVARLDGNTNMELAGVEDPDA